MALDHSRLGLENEFLENKSGRIFCFRQVYWTKSCQQIWVRLNQHFMLFYTSHLRWNSNMRRCFYHTDLRQNVVFHNFPRQIALIQSFFFQNHTKHTWAFNKTVQKIPKSPIRPAGSHFWQAPNFQWTLKELRFNIIKNLLCLFFI